MLSYLLSLSLVSLIVLLMSSINVITAGKRSLGQGNIFTPVCHSVQRRSCVVAGAGAWVAAGGCAWLWGVCGGACMVTGGAWLQGACMVVGGGGGCGGGCRGACMVPGVCVWLWGVCVVVGGACIGYDEIRSICGRYASYWNAFLLVMLLIISLMSLLML